MKDCLGGYAPHIADGILEALKSPGAVAGVTGESGPGICRMIFRVS